MSDVLLDYFFPISETEPTPQANTAFLKQVCLVVAPKDGGTALGVIVECDTPAAVAVLTGNTEAQQLFNAGMSRVYILPMADLDLQASLDGADEFFTVLISSDFDDDDVILAQATGSVTISSFANLLTTNPDTVTVAGQVFTAQAGAATLGTAFFQAATSNNATAASLAAQINSHANTKNKVIAVANSAVVNITAKDEGPAGNAFTLAYVDVGTASVGASVSGATLTGGAGLLEGAFEGVFGVSSTDNDFLEAQNAVALRCGFKTSETTLAKNMCFAFGKLLSNLTTWANQQYITMPFDDGINTVGAANSLFDNNKTSFVISSAQFGFRLALFTCGQEAIAAPYIKKNLEIDLQSEALSYISANEPAYTNTQASLLQDELQKIMDVDYIAPGLIEVGGKVSVTLEQDNFVGTSQITIQEPGALWRIFGNLRST